MRILLKYGNYADGNIFPMKVACFWHATLCSLVSISQAARRRAPEESNLRNRPLKTSDLTYSLIFFIFIVAIPTARDVMMVGQPPGFRLLELGNGGRGRNGRLHNLHLRQIL
jgi:hypothetical protein